MGQTSPVKSIDTNIVVRVITGDDPVQTPIADRLIAAEPVLMSATVMMESEWVLRSFFGYSRERLAVALSKFMEIDNVQVEDRERFLWALACFAKGADLADMLHVAMPKAATSFVTFDQEVARYAGADYVIEIP
jgi:predicted nucleic-acid-binding protein